MPCGFVMCCALGLSYNMIIYGALQPLHVRPCIVNNETAAKMKNGLIGPLN